MWIRKSKCANRGVVDQLRMANAKGSNWLWLKTISEKREDLLHIGGTVAEGFIFFFFYIRKSGIVKTQNTFNRIYGKETISFLGEKIT